MVCYRGSTQAANLRVLAAAGASMATPSVTAKALEWAYLMVKTRSFASHFLLSLWPPALWPQPLWLAPHLLSLWPPVLWPQPPWLAPHLLFSHVWLYAVRVYRALSHTHTRAHTHTAHTPAAGTDCLIACRSFRASERCWCPSLTC